MKGPDGTDTWYVPLPLAYIADLMEAYNILNLRALRDIRTLVPKEQLDDVETPCGDDGFAYRSQQSMKEVSSLCIS
jgi:hypothetical protein